MTACNVVRSRLARLAFATVLAALPTPDGAGAQTAPASGQGIPARIDVDRRADRSGPAPEDRLQVQVAPDAETTLSSPMVGRLVRLVERIGTRFAKGDLLAEFDCGEPRARLEMAEAELASATQTLEAKLQLKALNGAADVEVALASAAVARANAQERLSREQAALCTVHAPFAGSVVRSMVRPFQTVNAGQPMLEIVGAGPPRLRVVAPSRLLPVLRPGTPFTVSIEETGRSYPANVVRVNARVDSVSQTIEFEGRLRTASPDLLPGMTGTADMKGNGHAR